MYEPLKRPYGLIPLPESTPRVASAGRTGAWMMTDESASGEDHASTPITVVANRLPVARTGPDGAWEISPGGLVTALTPIMRPNRDIWIGWTGAPDEDIGSLEVGGISMRSVPLSAEEVELYYLGFSNKTLWPLFHDAIRPPEFSERAWEAYKRVNERFADAADKATPKGGIVWVQDYHLLLVPGLLRRSRPDVRVGIFLHTPVPPGRLLASLPRHEELLESLCSADLVGTQTEIDAAYLRENFDLPSRGDQVHAKLKGGARVDAFPISIDSTRLRDAAMKAEESGLVAELREQLGSRPTIFLGVDRLDYTKGIDLRLRAILAALDEGILSPKEFCFVQVAVPSREGLEEYEEVSTRVDALVGAINGRYGGIGSPVVYYKKEPMSIGELVPLYRAADVMLVTPVRDGMNLVAKEYLATRYDGSGELILSEFAGSAQQLAEATLVNPHDTHMLAQVCADACRRHRSGESSAAMTRLHESVMQHDVHEWSRRFLGALSARDARSPGSRRSPVVTTRREARFSGS